MTLAPEVLLRMCNRQNCPPRLAGLKYTNPHSAHAGRRRSPPARPPTPFGRQPSLSSQGVQRRAKASCRTADRCLDMSMQPIDSLGRNKAYFCLAALFQFRRVPFPDKKSDQPATMPGREIRSQPLNASPRLLFDQRIRADLSGPLAASGELQRLHRCDGEIYDAERPARVPGFVAAQERAQLCRSRMLCPGRRRPVYLGRNA
jgi:hypothetical protein